MSTLQIERIDTFSGHRGPVYSLEKGVDSLFYSAGSDGWVVQWNLAKPDLGKVIAQIEGSVYAMKLDATGILWIGHNYEGIQGIQVDDQSQVFAIPTKGLSIFSIAFVGSNAWIGHNGGLITVVDIATKSVVKHIKASSTSVRCFCVLADNRVAVGYSDGFIRVFDTTFQLVHSFKAHESSVFSLQSRGGELYSVGKDARIKRWSEDFQLLNEVIGHIYAIHDIQFSPDGKWFATASMDKTVKVWESETLTLRKVLDASRHGGHKNSVNKLIWSSFDDLLVSASDDKNLSIWKIH
ncbi:WD40 repeat domain-containing protein [Aquirufa sp. KTFRIE-69F]|uniref:WD40 repeat domain-containing protein n=1 Tax=Aquirufa originis TaxID=3096514 RepID=A0ABW6D305_9BACT